MKVCPRGFHWYYELLKFFCFAFVEKKGVVEFRHNPNIRGQNQRCSKFMVLWWPKSGRATSKVWQSALYNEAFCHVFVGGALTVG